MTTAAVAERFGAKRNGKGWVARCPAHDDSTPSLTISEGRKGGTVVHCHAGCSADAICAAVGLTVADLMPEERKPRQEIAALYDYTDQDGALLFQKVRYIPKRFLQRHPDPSSPDGWAWNLNGTRRVLYRLPEVLARPENAAIHLTEGEKDALALADWGLCATTNTEGASKAGEAQKWREEYTETLRGADVVIIPDNDEPGRARAEHIARQLDGVAARVRVLVLPNGKDVSDWRANGGTLGELERLTEAADTWHPTVPAPVEPCALPDVVKLFQTWLYLPDVFPVYAALATIAANYLPGDAVWLGLVAPASSAKSEILTATLGLPRVYPAATITPAALLSGTAKREKAVDATGGLLRAIGEFGVIVLKDFGSILSMRPDVKSEILAALREVYDGAWTRHVGTDGGRVLHWSGKVGLLFGATPVIDSHHSVMASMGERFLLCRIPPAGPEQAARALQHAGQGTPTMRRALADAVTGLFANARPDPRPITEEERESLVQWAALAVRLRSTVERDRQSRDIESVHGAEGPARLVLTLERLLAGLDTIGCDRATALKVVERVAKDSVPPLRRQAFDFLQTRLLPVDTRTVAEALGLPTSTVRRVLEDLAAYGLSVRVGGGQGVADTWTAGGDL
jgi:Toprim-like